MREPTMRGDSGTSILVSLIIVALFGTVSAVADFGHFKPETQLAQTGSTIPLKVDTPEKKEVEDKNGMKYTCPDGKIVSFACPQEAPLSEIKKLQQTCSPGFTYKVESKGTATLDPTKAAQGGLVTVTPKANQSPPCNAPPPKCEKGAAVPALASGGCKVEVCTGKKCVEAPEPIKPLEDLNVADKAIGGLAKELQAASTPELRKQLAATLGMSTPELDALGKILADEQISVEDAREEKAIEVSEAKQKLDEWASCAPTCDPAQAEKVKEDLVAKEAELKALEEQQKRLAAAQKNLSQIAQQGPPEQPPGTDPPKAPPEVPPGKKPPADDPPGKRPPGNVPPGADTFPKPQGGLGDASSWLKKILSGLGGLGGGLGGLFGGSGEPCGANNSGSSGYTQTQTMLVEDENGQIVQVKKQVPTTFTNVPCQASRATPVGSAGAGAGSGAGAAPANPALQCPVPPAQPEAALCQAQSGVWKPTYTGQCVTGWQCVPQAQSCPASPVQPDPSLCSGGSWRPTYNGACVANWECVGGTTDILVAQLACRPEVVDMDGRVELSYSCTSGTSAGRGFETGGAPSGTTSVKATAQQNSNAATYGLACTNLGKTVTKECSIQIAKPSIVLVANPKSVAARKAATLGWVTSGMRSCTISSLDIPPFTAENAGKTNVNGTTLTPALTSGARFVLHCVTLGGNTKDATIIVSVNEN